MATSLAQRLARIASASTLQLTHYGRKSGKPYEVTIWFMVEGETIYLATASVQRQWVRNVKARPDVSLSVRGETFSGTATRLTDENDRAHVTELVKQKYWYVRPLLWIAELFGLDQGGGAFRVRLKS